jgi:hypothetical protein
MDTSRVQFEGAVKLPAHLRSSRDDSATTWMAAMVLMLSVFRECGLVRHSTNSRPVLEQCKISDHRSSIWSQLVASELRSLYLIPAAGLSLHETTHFRSSRALLTRK